MRSISKQIWCPLALASMAISSEAFQCPSSSHHQRFHSPLQAAQNDIDNNEHSGVDRRAAINNILVGGLLIGAQSANAIVEGNVPPTVSKGGGEAEYRQVQAPMEAEVLPREAYKKLPSGVVYADISVGNGETVKEGSKLNIQWVLRRSNGYFVDSSAVSDSVPFIFIVGDPNGAIAGLDEGVRGMKAGGSRRVLIPPRSAWVQGIEDGKPGPLPVGFGPRQQMRRVMKDKFDAMNEYIFLEVKLTKVR